MEAVKVKHPEKKLVFVLDNLWSHKSSLVMRIMQEDRATMLLLPSNTPQFSPIENMFGHVKGVMKDYMFKKKEDTAMELMRIMFELNERRIQGFFKKTLNNMNLFWSKLDYQHLTDKIAKTVELPEAPEG